MQTNRLSPALGIEVRDLDVSEPLSDEGFHELRQTWLDSNGLLIVREQGALRPEQHLSLSRRFGPLFGEAEDLQDTVKRYLHPEHPAIYRVSNKVQAGQPLGRARAGDYWHSDVSFRERPAMASLLHAIEIPAVGGDTLFANTQVAWEALSPAMQRLLEPLDAIHDFAVRASLSYAADVVIDDDFDGENRCVHPVAIRHPETGRRGLFVNPGFTAALVGFEPAESQALLEFLYAHCTREEFMLRHRWQPGDLVIWDNRCVVHKAVNDYQADRYMHRTTVIASRPSR